MQQPVLLKPVCHVCKGELAVTGISSLSHGVITNLLPRGEDQPVVAGRRVPGCRCFRTMPGGPPPKKARVQHTCWICKEKIEWTENQPIHLKDRVQTFLAALQLPLVEKWWELGTSQLYSPGFRYEWIHRTTIPSALAGPKNQRTGKRIRQAAANPSFVIRCCWDNYIIRCRGDNYIYIYISVVAERGMQPSIEAKHVMTRVQTFEVWKMHQK